MAPRSPRLRLGDGATITVLKKYLRPSQTVKEHFPNEEPGRRFVCTITGRDIRMRLGKSVESVKCVSDDFPGTTLRCAIRWAIVTAEGPPNDIWTTEQFPAAPVAAPGQALQGNPIDPNIFQS